MMSTYGHSNFDDDMQENDGSQNGGSIKRKGRGYNKPKWGKSGKESIEFTKDGLCVVPKDAQLGRYLGSLARNYNLLPLSPTDWRAFDDAYMDKLWKVISEKEHGHEPDPIEAYELVHKRKDEQRSWVDDASEQMGALISQKLAELSDINGEVTPEVRLQAYVSARGFETGGRVRGYGEVVTPDMVPWVQETQPASMVRRSRRGRAYALLQSECLSLKEMYEKQQTINEKQGKEIEELRHMIQSSQNLSSNPRSSPEQPSSAQEESLHTSQQLVNQHQPPNQQQSSSQQQPLFQQNLSYPQFGPIYYSHQYHPSLYAQVSQPTRDFTTTLNDIDFLQFMGQGSTADK